MHQDTLNFIGRYKVEREIGRGGMAVVYKAFDPNLERPVAIKLIKVGAFPPDTLNTVRERFKREAKALALLNHPSIVRVYDYGEWNGAPFLVMDYIEGATLKDVKKPIPVGVAVRLLNPIANALHYVHQRNILHRDVKPSNIMITREKNIVLTDFGIAKWLESDDELFTLTGTGTGIGTPEYMSPEQGRGYEMDWRSDAYSLAIVFFELITGRKPFQGKTPIDIVLKQANDPIPDPRIFVPELNESVKRFFDQALAKNPGARHETMNDFVRDLEGLRLQALTHQKQTPNRSSIHLFPLKDKNTPRSFINSTNSSLQVHQDDASNNNSPVLIPESRKDSNSKPRKKTPLWAGPAFAAVLAFFLISVGIRSINNYIDQVNKINQLSTVVVLKTEAMRLVELDASETELAAESTKMAESMTQEALHVMQKETDDAEIRKIQTGTAFANLLITETAQSFGTQQAMHAIQQETQEAQVKDAQTAAAINYLNMTLTAEVIAAKTATKEAMNQRLANLKVGDHIFLGQYEQDNNSANGKEPIEWRVLEIRNSEALLISEVVLDVLPYNDEGGNVTWSKSSLRKWLNGRFYMETFSDSEKSIIRINHSYNPPNPRYPDTYGGITTEDKVFLLNFGEARSLFTDEDNRRAGTSLYAAGLKPDNTNRYENDGENSTWWLRTSGQGNNFTAIVVIDGDILELGERAKYENGVRPCIRIGLR